MIFRMDQFLLSLSAGLDAVEGELFGVTTNHGKRIAILTMAMGRRLGWNDDELIGVASCSLLHDNALSEHSRSMKPDRPHDESFRSHCIRGEENALHLPFPADVAGVIKYHHEYADRSGPFGMDANNIPMAAQMIALAEDLDTHHDFHRPSEAADTIRVEIQKKRGTFYTAQAADAMLAVLDDTLLTSLRDDRVDATFRQMMPQWTVKKEPSELMEIAKIVASIIDYKSKFTAKHTIQIANRAYWMARYYGSDPETCATIYLAASFHDIGKLITPTAILEKPNRLTEEEYCIIQDHVLWSYRLLKDVEGFGEICRWATTHHRKLDGWGYPELPDEYLDLDFFSRMMACIDVYQAVRETRPYHAGRTHRETMDIMWNMANRGEIDRDITRDMDAEMARFETGDGDVPDPCTYLSDR